MTLNNIKYGIQYGQVEPDPDLTGPENPKKPDDENQSTKPPQNPR